MRKLIVFISVIIWLTSCQKDSLLLVNPNEPGLEAFKTEAGINKAMYGIYNPIRYTAISSEDGMYFTWFSQANHNAMGDVTTISAGNFGWRWANQVTKIIRPSGVEVLPPSGGAQALELNNRNSRDFGSDNVLAHEWVPMYSLIGTCNLILGIIDEVAFTGTDAEVTIKKNTYKAWLYWWKGFAYSRIGSLHSHGIIVNGYGEVSTNYVGRQAIIDEASRNFNLAKDALVAIPDGTAAYEAIMSYLIPAQFQFGNGGLITPSMFTRNINTYMARNILVNKYASELSAADLTSIETLANNGIGASDKIFNIRTDVNDAACLLYQTTWSAYRMLVGWENLSERLVQDFKTGDARYTRNVSLKTTPVFNPRGRGISYGTRYNARSIDTGGDWVSLTAGLAEMPMAGSYEENQLMLAEAKIRNSQIDAGLAHIDNVRAHQNAGLAAVSGTGLTLPQALEELRIERRIGLFLKGVAFYDARRWGILKPIAQGGGRTNANVVVAADGTVEPCTIEYNYMEWFPVPANETDFNPLPAAAVAVSSSSIYIK